MVLAELMPQVDIEPSSDEQYVRDIASRLLPRVEAMYIEKGGQVANLQIPEENCVLPLGGNIEQQQSSGVKAIKVIMDKLDHLLKAPVDLGAIDYPCILRAMKFLDEHNEDWRDDMQKLNEIAINAGKNPYFL